LRQTGSQKRSSCRIPGYRRQDNVGALGWMCSADGHDDVVPGVERIGDIQFVGQNHDRGSSRCSTAQPKAIRIICDES
jgi:hypothetical protein